MLDTCPAGCRWPEENIPQRCLAFPRYTLPCVPWLCLILPELLCLVFPCFASLCFAWPCVALRGALDKAHDSHSDDAGCLAIPTPALNSSKALCACRLPLAWSIQGSISKPVRTLARLVFWPCAPCAKALRRKSHRRPHLSSLARPVLCFARSLLR